MFKLLRNFRKTGSEPWYRKNSCGVERFAPGPDNVELRGGAFLTVPGPIALQRQRRAPCGSLHKPESTRGHKDKAQGIGPHHALALPALVLPETCKGIAITDGDFDRPPLAILREDRFEMEREVGGEKRLHLGQRLALAWLYGSGPRWTVDHYHSDPPPRKNGMPQPGPRLDERPGFGGMGLPAGPFAGQGFRRSHEWTFFRRTTSPVAGNCCR
jgi:hypothetical protein